MYRTVNSLLVTILLFLNVCSGAINKWDVFSTKTAYPWAVSELEPALNSGSHTGVNNKLCKAVHVSMVVRHGARYPSDGATEEIADLHRHLLRYKNSPLFPNISTWMSPYTDDMAGELAPAGEREQYGLGRRAALKFETLFNNAADYIWFVSSSKERALDSSLNFNNGMRSVLANTWRYKNEVNNSIMRFYDGCENYETQVDDNDTHFQEFIKYDDTLQFVEIRKSLEKKLGLDDDLDPEDVYLIYELCSYDKYIKNITSFWCDLITDQQRTVLEYGQDIEKYYESSYGHPINSKMPCPLVSDIFQTMDRAINDTWNYDRLPAEAKDMGYLAGKFRFGHSETLVPLMTALGLFKDTTPLLSTNMAAMANRKFKTSAITPFSGNVAFVLYACDELSHSVTDAERQFMVQLHVNEKIVSIPGCEALMCPYDQARRLYSDLIDRCNIHAICDPDDDSAASDRPIVHLMLVLLSVLVCRYLL